jgi:alkylhydroperoxidase/carboxymuconolactone decarboxylase family protein YurZ
VRESSGFEFDPTPVRIRTVQSGNQAQTPTFDQLTSLARDEKEANVMADTNQIAERRGAVRDELAERRARDRRDLEQHQLRVMIESMLRRGCSEEEIIDAVEQASAS